jgi:hypothetical protein
MLAAWLKASPCFRAPLSPTRFHLPFLVDS